MDRLMPTLNAWASDQGLLWLCPAVVLLWHACCVGVTAPQETFGAMAKTEKIAFILEQVRLCLEKQDFIRAQILSRKVSPKAFVERKGEAHGDIGIEGTAIEAPETVRAGCWGEGGAEEGARKSGRGGAQRDWGKDKASDEVCMKGVVIGAECGEGRGAIGCLRKGLGGELCHGTAHAMGDCKLLVSDHPHPSCLRLSITSTCPVVCIPP